MEVEDIITYRDVVTAEKASLQKGMNFGVGKKYSIFLMSLRENTPYANALDLTDMLTLEGHDEPQRAGYLRFEPVLSELMLGGTEIPKKGPRIDSKTPSNLTSSKGYARTPGVSI